MTQYVYLVQKQSGGVLEVIGKALEPKSPSVLDFLDEFATISGAISDKRLLLEDAGVQRNMEGRLIPRTKITQHALRKAMDAVSGVNAALTEYFHTLAKTPATLFEHAPSGKENWVTFQELLELRPLLLQAQSKPGRSIALCHQ